MDRLLALQASAGSGKTFALSVRYLSLLFLDAKASNIVALTFTKKAANEMKERIFSTLINLENTAELDEICTLTCKSKDDILKQKDRVLNSFLNSNLHVETIDAFFGKILRKFSLHVGIMPDFKTSDTSHEKKLQEFFIKEAYKDKKSFNLLVNFLIYEKKKLPNIFDFFKALYEKSKELDLDIYPRYDYPKEDAIMRKAGQISLYLKDVKASKTALGIFDVDSLEQLISKSFWERESLQYRTFSKVYTDKLDEMFFELKALYRKYCLEKEAYILGEIFHLFKLYEKINLELIKQTNELTFSDVSFLVYKLLRQDISSDFLYFRLDGKIEHLLIDEFQDTNVVQLDILAPIIEEISSGRGIKGFRSFFYVGDVKQSIYRFRGGVSELFASVAKEFDVKISSLDTNYRSYGNLVKYVNGVFANKFEDFIPQKVAQKNENKGFVKVETCEDVLDKLKENLELLFDNNVSEDDIAVLCHTNAEANLIKEELLGWKKNLHVSIDSTKKLTQSVQVMALIEFLKFSYFGYKINEKNTLVLLGKSFEENLHVKIENFDIPLEKLLINAVDLLGLNGCDEDILYFIELSSEYENIQSLLFDLPRFTQSSKSSEQLGIKILTIHKSKGLEFEHVVVLDKLARPNNQSGNFIYEYENERLKQIHVRIKNREFVDEEYKNAKEKEKAFSFVDIKNALYVAFTRAKKSLIILQKYKSSCMDFLNLEYETLGEIESSKKTQKSKKLHVFSPAISYGLQKSQREEDEKDYDIKSIYFGLALHYLLEMTCDFTESSLQNAMLGVENKYGEFVDTDELFKRALLLINDKQFLSLIKNAKLKKEQPILYKGERKQLDLLAETDEKYIIIDYKTSPQVYDEHISQVKLYKRALQSFAKKEVEAWLFYIRDNHIQSLHVN